MMLAITACENKYDHEVHYVTPTPVDTVTITPTSVAVPQNQPVHEMGK
jgi:hypothetical protein